MGLKMNCRWLPGCEYVIPPWNSALPGRSL